MVRSLLDASHGLDHYLIATNSPLHHHIGLWGNETGRVANSSTYLWPLASVNMWVAQALLQAFYPIKLLSMSQYRANIENTAMEVLHLFGVWRRDVQKEHTTMQPKMKPIMNLY